MKKLLIVFASLFFSFATKAQEEKVWDYPVKPGTPAWAGF